MSNVINLGRARKRKRREAAQRTADANAIKHGRTKADKARDRLQQAQLRATVDGARLDSARSPDDPERDPDEPGPP